VNVCVCELRSIEGRQKLQVVMTLLPNVDVICNRQQLAEVLGVSDRQIDRLVVDHVLKPARCKLRGKHFRLSAAVQSYLAHRERYVTERSAGSNGAYDAARTRRMAAIASREELRLAAEQGEYLHKPELEFHFGMLLRNCRDRILAIPSRTMHQLAGQTDARECNRIIGAECNLALNEIADGKCFDWQRMRREARAYLQEQGFPPDEAAKTADEMVSRRRDRNDELPPE
jgi:phage terminase Nu1 subunit (DNA packaging protein)